MIIKNFPHGFFLSSSIIVLFIYLFTFKVLINLELILI